MADSTTAATKKKIRILPPPPRLLTFSTTLYPIPDAEKRADWTDEFEIGWAAGMDTIRAVWTRLALSSRSGLIRLMRMDGDAIFEEGAGYEEGLAGLVEVAPDGEGWDWDGRPPAICFGDPRDPGDLTAEDEDGELDVDDVDEEEDVPSGPLELGGHAAGCGHVVVGNTWDLYERIESDAGRV